MADDPRTERRFGPLPLEALDDEQRAVADAILDGPRGKGTRLKGPFEALLCSPNLAGRVEQLGLHIRFASSVPTVLNEMAICMVGRHYDAQFEWWAHRQMALKAGLPEVVLDDIAARRRPELDGDGEVVFDFVSQLLADANVSDEAFAAVVDRWGKRGAIDLIGTVGYYTLVSYILNVDRYPLPPGVAPLPD